MAMQERKRHRKSRLGCQTCKRRKIKCDESRPQCSNCIRFGVPCDFSPIYSKSLSRIAASTPGRGRPRADWRSWSANLALAANDSTSEITDHSSSTLNVQELELFHNFILHTGPSLGRGRGLWCEGAPKLGFQQPCILHLMLALSAHQLARLNPVHQDKYSELAEQYSQAGLRAATAFVRDMTPGNSPALYIVSVFVCFSAFAKGPVSGNLLLIAKDGQIPWLSLLKGVRLVVEVSGWASIFSGPLAAYSNLIKRETEALEGYKTYDPQSTPETLGKEDWRRSLDSVTGLIDEHSQQPFKEACAYNLNVLKECFMSTFAEKQDVGLRVEGDLHIVISWIYRLKDPFVEALRGEDLTALVILGHFCVLLRTIESYWFMEGWAAHVLNEITQISEASRQWLTWPIQYLEGSSSPHAESGSHVDIS